MLVTQMMITITPLDEFDTDDNNEFVCSDTDEDTCDDCSQELMIHQQMVMTLIQMDYVMQVTQMMITITR